MIRETWETKSGDVLFIDEMEISHIQNCIRMLTKKMNEAENEENDEEWADDDHGNSGAIINSVGKSTYRAWIKMFEQEMLRRTKLLSKTYCNPVPGDESTNGVPYCRNCGYSVHDGKCQR